MKQFAEDEALVFPDYCDERHCVVGDGPLPTVRNSSFFGGWNFGGTDFPGKNLEGCEGAGCRQSAFVLLQVTPRPWQVHALVELKGQSPEGLEAFIGRVLKTLQIRVPGYWDEILHSGDAATLVQEFRSGKSPKELAAKLGVGINKSDAERTEQLGAVHWLLGDFIDQSTSRFKLDGNSCPVLREGFRGAYRFREASNQAVGSHRVLADRPAMDGFGDVQEALQLAALQVRKRFKRGRFVDAYAALGR
jgi:hypothetical protein